MSFKTVCIIALFFVASQVACQKIIDDPIDLAPESLYNVAPAPYESYSDAPDLSPEESANYTYLEQCAEKMGEECGQMVFSSIFKGIAFDYEKCCGSLLGMGKKCHDDMINYLVKLPEFRDGNDYLSISDGMWNKCTKLANSPSS